MYRERQNMKESRHTEPGASHDIVAVDSDGNQLYEAEMAWSEEAAESEREACQQLLESGEGNIPDNVDHFEVKAR